MSCHIAGTSVSADSLLAAASGVSFPGPQASPIHRPTLCTVGREHGQMGQPVPPQHRALGRSQRSPLWRAWAAIHPRAQRHRGKHREEIYRGRGARGAHGKAQHMVVPVVQGLQKSGNTKILQNRASVGYSGLLQDFHKVWAELVGSCRTRMTTEHISSGWVLWHSPEKENGPRPQVCMGGNSALALLLIFDSESMTACLS